MSPEEIAKARKIIAAATPGKWFVMYPGSAEGCAPAIVVVECERIERVMEEFVMTDQKWIERHEIHVDHRRDFSDPYPDAAFISAARTGWPQALDKIEALDGIIQEYFDDKNKLPDKLQASAAREKDLTEERDQLLEALELKDKLIAHQREQHAAREKILVEALIHIACLKRLDRYNCTLETTREFARETLAKLQAAEGGDLK